MPENIPKLHFLPFYLNDWETDNDVKLMGPSTRYLYFHLLLHQWREGSIPADRKQLRRILVFPHDPLTSCPGYSLRDTEDTGESEEHLSDHFDYDGALDQILKCFRSNGRGQLSNPRLECVRNAQIEKYCNLSARGKSGKSKQMTATAKHNVGHTYTYTECSKEQNTNTAPTTVVAAPAKHFVPPTESELVAYMTDQKITDPVNRAHDFIAYYETRGWVPGGQRAQMKSWKAAVRTWKIRENGNGNRHSTKYQNWDEQASLKHLMNVKLED